MELMYAAIAAVVISTSPTWFGYPSNDPANPPTHVIPNGKWTSGGLGSPDWFRDPDTGQVYWGLAPELTP